MLWAGPASCKFISGAEAQSRSVKGLASRDVVVVVVVGAWKADRTSPKSLSFYTPVVVRKQVWATITVPHPAWWETYFKAL